MKFNIKKKAFSLTELLIVLVILSVLFAAMAPIMTKRGGSASSSEEQVWQKVTGTQDIYFDRLLTGSKRSAAFFGLKPKDLPAGAPSGKVYIKANSYPDTEQKGQWHLQFRYGDKGGALTGVVGVGHNDNLYVSTLPALYWHWPENQGVQNTAFGKNALLYGGNVAATAIGDGAMSHAGGGTHGNVAIGKNAGMNLTSTTCGDSNWTNKTCGQGSYNVLIGSETGKSPNIQSTVAVGSNILSWPESRSLESVFIGSGVASFGLVANNNYNTIVGSTMYVKNSSIKNTIIGYGAYNTVSEDVNPMTMTVVGYDACTSIQMLGYNNQGPKTCIGYHSASTRGYGTGAPHSTGGLTDANDPWANDKGEHIFIGGTPHQFNGRAVLEVHNFNDKHKGTKLADKLVPSVAPTVVLNSHLVVRGNLYFPSVHNGGYVVAHSLTYALDTASDRNGSDHCTSDCEYRLFGRNRRHPKWKAGEAKACRRWYEYVGSGLKTYGEFLISVYTGGLIGAGIYTGVISTDVGIYFGPWEIPAIILASEESASSFSRDYKEVSYVTGSQMMISKDSVSCTSAGKPYPNGTNGCPNLRVSDLRLKENITENTDALDKIMYIMPYSYTFKNDLFGTHRVGVMAQDLKDFLPDSVAVDKDGYLTIRWDEMFYVTINSIKALDKNLLGLSNDVSGIENDISATVKSHKSTKKRIDDLNKRISKLEK